MKGAICDQKVRDRCSAVRSIANSRTSGTVMAYNNGTFVTTVAAGTGKNILVSITALSCA